MIKLQRFRRFICLLLPLLLLIPLALPAKAASEKRTFGVITDSQKRTLVGVAVKNGSDIFVYTASQDALKTGAKGTFTIDGKTKVSVTLASNELSGSIQRWKATEKNTTLANSLYETAKPKEKQDAAALYLAYDLSGELVKRQTAVTVSGIVQKLAIALHLKGHPGESLSDKAFGLGLLLDASGKAVGVLVGPDAAICTWYDSAKTSAKSGTIKEKDSALISSDVKSIVALSSISNPNLSLVSMLYSQLAQILAKEKPDLDYCASISYIAFRESGLRTLKNGKKIADAYGNSLSRSFSKGAGACIDDDSYWYLSLTFPTKSVDSETIYYNAIALITGAIAADVGVTPGKEISDSVEMAEEIFVKLFEDQESTVVTVGKLVFFRISDSNQIIIGVDSENFFKNYPTTIQNYKRVS